MPNGHAPGPWRCPSSSPARSQARSSLSIPRTCSGSTPNFSTKSSQVSAGGVCTGRPRLRASRSWYGAVRTTAVARSRNSAGTASGSNSTKSSPSSIAYDETSSGHHCSSFQSGCGDCQCQIPERSSRMGGNATRVRGTGDDPAGSLRRRLNPVGNERLTALVGALLLGPVIVEAVTILLGVHAFMSLHVFVGLALIPPVILKLAATGWRFARYYSLEPAYVELGPPRLALRLLAPLFVAATFVLFASGVAMGILHGQALVVARRLHGPASVVWLVLFAVKCPRLPEAGSQRQPPGAPRGRALATGTEVPRLSRHGRSAVRARRRRRDGPRAAPLGTPTARPRATRDVGHAGGPATGRRPYTRAWTSCANTLV